MWDLGGRGCTGGKKPTIRKKSGLQKKQSAPGRPSPVDEQVCQQNSIAKGRGLVARQAKEKCAWPFPPSPACPSAVWGMDARAWVRPWRRMCYNQHSFGEVWPSSLYGRCYR